MAGTVPRGRSDPLEARQARGNADSFLLWATLSCALGGWRDALPLKTRRLLACWRGRVMDQKQPLHASSAVVSTNWVASYPTFLPRRSFFVQHSTEMSARKNENMLAN